MGCGGSHILEVVNVEMGRNDVVPSLGSLPPFLGAKCRAAVVVPFARKREHWVFE